MTKLTHNRGAPNKYAYIGALVLPLGLLISACGNDESELTEAGPPVDTDDTQWDEIVTEAENEGSVVVYSSLSGVEETFEAFSEEYPEIDVQVERAPTAEIVTRLDQEFEVGAEGADVTMHSSAEWFQARDEQDEFAALQVSPTGQADGWMDMVDQGYVGIFSNPFLIAWNTENAEPIANVADVTDRSGVGIPSADISPVQAYQYKVWNDEFGDDYLSTMAENGATIYGSNVPASQALASGELDYLIGVTPTTLLALQEDGAPVETAIPDEAGSGVLYNAAVLRNAPNPNAAQVFTNWLMSEEGASELVEFNAPAATRLEVPDSLPWEDVVVPDPGEWSSESYEEWVSEQWRPYFSG